VAMVEKVVNAPRTPTPTRARASGRARRAEQRLEQERERERADDVDHEVGGEGARRDRERALRP